MTTPDCECERWRNGVTVTPRVLTPEEAAVDPDIQGMRTRLAERYL